MVGISNWKLDQGFRRRPGKLMVASRRVGGFAENEPIGHWREVGRRAGKRDVSGQPKYGEVWWGGAVDLLRGSQGVRRNNRSDEDCPRLNSEGIGVRLNMMESNPYSFRGDGAIKMPSMHPELGRLARKGIGFVAA